MVRTSGARELTLREQSNLRSYLRMSYLKRTDIPFQYQRPPYKRYLERAKQACPLEFASQVEIHIPESLLGIICEETQISVQEQLERACLFSYAFSTTDTIVELTLTNVLNWSETCHAVGEEIKRTRRTIEGHAIRSFIAKNSSQGNHYSYLHTHPNAIALVSASDLHNQTLGKIEFVSTIKDNRFLLVPYRADSRCYYTIQDEFVPQENLRIVVTGNGNGLIAEGAGMLVYGQQ